MRTLAIPPLAGLGALLLAALSPQRSEAGWLFHCCKKPRYEYVVVPDMPPHQLRLAAPVSSAEPCSIGYYPAVCEDGRWKKSTNALKMACVRESLIGEPCARPRPLGEVVPEEQRPAAFWLYPMIFNNKAAVPYWRRAYVGEPIDGFLPIAYHQPNPTPDPGPKPKPDAK